MGREKLRVEAKAEELVAEIERLRRLVRQPINAVVHLEKSGDSALFNTGEGAALFNPRGKAAAYNIARKEANEVQKALKALVLKRRLNDKQIAKACDLADCVIAMLTIMIKNLEQQF